MLSTALFRLITSCTFTLLSPVLFSRPAPRSGRERWGGVPSSPRGIARTRSTPSRGLGTETLVARECEWTLTCTLSRKWRGLCPCSGTAALERRSAPRTVRASEAWVWPAAPPSRPPALSGPWLPSLHPSLFRKRTPAEVPSPAGLTAAERSGAAAPPSSRAECRRAAPEGRGGPRAGSVPWGGASPAGTRAGHASSRLGPFLILT